MPVRSAIFLLAGALAASAETTFYKDVLPVLQARCQECHRAGEIGAMPLTTYSETRPWARAMKEAVLSKKMPPWFADPHYGHFSNDLSLSPKEITTLAAWADGGAREGKHTDAPPSREFVDGWRIPKPDVVFELPHPVQVPSSGTIDYQFFLVPTGFTEDRWVEAIEVRPTNRAVVHHAIVLTQSNGQWTNGGMFLGGYAPGSMPQIWKPGDARLIRAGATLVFQMHYTANGKPAMDRTQIGLVFAKHSVERQIVAMQAVNHWFEIPPGDPNFAVDSVSILPGTASLVGLRPHMHVRGKSFEFRAVFPDGHTEVLLRVPKYDFNWQPYYYLETPVQLPRGTRIECTAHFDNSLNNAFNPNPRTAVKWGDQSWDEMMIGWFDVAVPVGNSRNIGMRLRPE